jgi:beta-galactosidase
MYETFFSDSLQVIFELDGPNPECTINFIKDPDFTCGSKQ